MASILVSEFKTSRGATTNGQKARRRDPVLATVGRWLGHHAPRWAQVRTAAYTWPSAGLATWAAWTTDARLGALAGAASLLVLEYLGRGEADQ
jgi:hypothetical protein